VRDKNGVEFYHNPVGEAGEQGSRGAGGRGRNVIFLQCFSLLLLTFNLLYLTFNFSPFAFAQEPSALQRELESNITNSQALLRQRAEEIASIEAELGATATQLEAQIAERDRISNELVSLRDQQVVLTDGIATLEAQLAETRSKLDTLQAEVADLKARVQELLVNVYKQRSGRYAGILAEASSLHDLQVKNHYLSLLSDQDVELVTQLSVTATELITTQDTQNQQLSELQTQKTALEENQVALETTQANLEHIIAELESTQEGQLASRKDLLLSQASLETTIADLQNQRAAEITRLQEEARRKREEAARAANALEQERLQREAAQAEQRADNLSEPVTSLPAISSGYASPVSNAQIYLPFGAGNCGSCIALRANTDGAAVVAVQPGIVIGAEFLGANDGYLVSVQQSDGMIFAYSNLQNRPTVQLGDKVDQGDILGYLGGGLLTPPDVLKLYVRTARNQFVDPAPVLGF
jgi:septal ring factor EnvC (AmiA/AmiB activator)